MLSIEAYFWIINDLNKPVPTKYLYDYAIAWGNPQVIAHATSRDSYLDIHNRNSLPRHYAIATNATKFKESTATTTFE